MGQSGSRESSPPAARRRDRLSVRFGSGSHARHESEHDVRSTAFAPPPSRARRRFSSIPSFSHGRSSSADPDLANFTGLARRTSRLTRARSTLSSIPHIFTRNSGSSILPTPLSHSSSTSPPASTTYVSGRRAFTAADDSPLTLPSVPVPELGLDYQDFDDGTTDADSATSSGRPGDRASQAQLRDRVQMLDQSFRNMTNPLRRRRSPSRRGGEDQAAMLSRLLSVAAAATAATLMGSDQRTVRNARSAAGDEDGTFDSFLQSLENGRIATALRQGSEGRESPGQEGGLPLNFFRMFRFGPIAHNPRRPEGGRNTLSGEARSDTPMPGASSSDDDSDHGRLVPVIIVGIRAINPDGGLGDDHNLPPFLEALHAPEPLPSSPSGESTDSILQPTRFSHTRRQSRAAERSRPVSTISDSPALSPPPPAPSATSTSPLSSGISTPGESSSPSSPTSTLPSRRGSFIRRNTGTSREADSIEPVPHRTARQRLSDSDFRFGSGSSRRNGVVGPDRPEDSTARSWIIYVLGGTYPENHPILTTPSLYTDSPTYEDMLLISALLGPAKPPTATEDDIAAAPGLYTIHKIGDNLAVLPEGASSTQEHEQIPEEQRCLVCLCDYEEGESARKLVRCGHLFHKECIDMWLTTGRNSCPLCRAQGVDEKPKENAAAAAAAAAPSTLSSSATPTATAAASSGSTSAPTEAF